MQLTIRNRVHEIQGFVYETVRWIEHEGEQGVEVDVRPRANSPAVCSGCGQPRPGYDALTPRRVGFVPL